LKKLIIFTICITAAMLFSPLSGLAEDARPLTLLYTGNIEGKINPIPQ
jgi:hypothetical protein